MSGRQAPHALTPSATLTKAIVLTPVVLLLHLPVTVLGVTLGLTLDAASHYWADRGTTLRRLAHHCGKSEFYSLGMPDHPAHPTTAQGTYAPTLGTGAYALDQSWHILWLGIATLLIAAL